MTKALSRFLVALRRYAVFMRWLWADGVWPAKLRVALIIGTGLLGVFAEVSALALILYYARAFATASEIEVGFLGRALPAQTSHLLLFSVALAVCLALLLSAVLRYVSQSQLLELRSGYMGVCAARVLSVLTQAPHGPTLGSGALVDDQRALLLARTDSLFLGRILYVVVGALVQVGVLLWSTALLFKLDPQLSLLLLGVASISGVFLYRINVKAVAVSKALPIQARASAAEFRALIDLQAHSPQAAAETAVARPDLDSFDLPSTRRWLETFTARLKVVAESEFAANLLFATAMAVVLAVLGMSIMGRGAGWQSLAIYLVAMRYALVAFRAVARTGTSVNRFYPNGRRYADFVSSFAPQSPSDKTPLRSYRVDVALPQIAGSSTRATLSLGDRWAVVGRIPLNYYTLSFILGSLIGHDRDLLQPAMRVCSAITSQIPAGASLAGLGYADKGDHEELIRWAAQAELAEALTALDIEELDAPVDWRTAHRGLCFLVRAVPALRQRGDRWTFLEATGFRWLPGRCRKALLEELSRSTVVLVFDGHRGVGHHDEDAVALLDRQGLAAVGSREWFEAHVEEIVQWLSALRESETATAGGGELDEE